MTYINLPSLSANQVITASYINSLNEDIRIVGRHNHSGSLGEGSTQIGVASSGASALSNFCEIFTCFAPSQSNFSSSFSGCHYLLIGGMATDTAIPASIKYPTGLFSGIYNVQTLSETGASFGTASVLIGTSSIGTFDMYSSTSVANVFTSYTASIPTSASYTITVSSDGSKNASSSVSKIRIRAIYMRRIENY